MTTASLPRKVLEVEVSNFDGDRFSLIQRLFQVDASTMPKVRNASIVHLAGIDRRDLGNADSARMESLLKLRDPDQGDWTDEWSLVTDVCVHIHTSARRLAELPWEKLASVEGEGASRKVIRRVYRFAPSPTDPRPRVRKAAPSHFVLALNTLRRDLGGETKIAGHKVQLHVNSTLPKLIETLETAVLTSASETGDAEPASDALLVLKTTVSEAEEYSLRFAPMLHGLGIDSPPDVEPLYKVAAKLGQLQEKMPRVVVLINEADNQRVALAPAAHQLTEVGIPGVVILPKVHKSATLKTFIEKLATQLTSIDDNPDDLPFRVWAALPPELMDEDLRPIIVVNTRSGVLWYRPRDFNSQHGQSLSNQFNSAKKKSVVVGPLYKGVIWEWQRGPVESLFVRAGVPTHPEDHRRSALLASYLHVQAGRTFVQILWFMSWLEAAAKFLPRYKSEVSPAQSLADAPKDDPAPLNKLSPAQSLADALKDDPALPINLPTKTVYSRTEKINTLKTPPPDYVNARDPIKLLEQIKDPEKRKVMRESAERVLKSVLDLWLPDAGSTKTLNDSPYGKLAQLGADLYITLDPSPLLEYALAQQNRPVRYTIWPWFLGTDEWRTSKLSEGKNGPPVHLVYLAGAVHDPATLLLTEQEIAARLPPPPYHWGLVLQEVGNTVSTDSAMLFLGFEPEQTLFQQLLLRLLPTSMSRVQNKIVVTMRPGHDVFAYPEYAASYLKILIEEHHLAMEQRLDHHANSVSPPPVLPAPPTPTGASVVPPLPPPPTAPSLPESPIQLYWGSPLQFVKKCTDEPRTDANIVTT